MTRDVPPAPSAAALGDDPREPAESPDASPPPGDTADASPPSETDDAASRRRPFFSAAPPAWFANARVRLEAASAGSASAAAALEAFLTSTRAALPDELLDAVRESLVESASSARDVGWLSREAAVMDGTARFERLLASIQSDTERRSPPRSPSRLFARPDAPAVLLVPGLFARYYPRYLEDVREHLEARGATVRVSIAADGEGTVLANAAALRDEILQFANELDENKLPPLVGEGEGEGGDRDEFIHGARVPKGVSDARLYASRRTTQRRIVLVGHSKGACDAAAALALYPSALAPRVAGVVASQCPYGGSPIASDLLATEASSALVGGALARLVGASSPSDAAALLGAMRDVTYASRRAFLARHPLPPGLVPTVSFHTETTSPASLLFASAAYTRRRYGVANDGLVARCDAEVPGSVAVRWAREFDHADAAYPEKAPEKSQLDAWRRETDEWFRTREEQKEKKETKEEEEEKKEKKENASSKENALSKEKASNASNASSERSGLGTRGDAACRDPGSADANGLVPSAVAVALARRARDEGAAAGSERTGAGRRGGFVSRVWDGGKGGKGATRFVEAFEGAGAEGSRKGRAAPFVGEAIVGAYCALRRAAPDRVRGAPSAGAVYEALVALVLEQDRVGPEARGRTDRDGAEDEPFPFPAANEKDASGTGKENAGTNERPWAEEWSAPDEDVFRGAEPRVTVDE